MSTTESTGPAENQDIIGRTDINDLEAILSVSNTDVDATIRTVQDNADAIFTWDYEKGARPGAQQALREGQGRPVERRDRPAVGDSTSTRRRWPSPTRRSSTAVTAPCREFDVAGTPFEKLDREGVARRSAVESQNWTLSQFMHGEQGALLCTAKIVETVPWIDAKYYASTQVMDEARHVEVFAKYLDTKLSGHYPVNAHLGMLLDDIVEDSRWDMTYLGMQIMVEGLALAAFGFMHQLTTEPLLKQLLRYVMSDEARHVAFGVLTLKEYYAGADHRRADRAAGVRLRGRRAHARPLPPAGGLGADGCPGQGRHRAGAAHPDADRPSSMLFAKIVPNCRKLGLLDAGDGWLRQKFGELGVIQFEDWADTEEEVDAFALVGLEKT